MAGLTASFIEVDPWSSEHWIIKQLRGAEPNYRHVAVQVEFESGVLPLDPNLLAVNPSHKNYLPLTLRQFVALELSNRAMGPTVKGLKGDIGLLGQAIRLDDTLDIPFLNRAKLHLEQENNPEKALKDAQRAVALNPRNALAYGGRAKVFFRQKKFDQAIEDLNKAINLNPLIYDFFQNRGAIWLAQKQAQKAEADFIKALQLDPNRALPNILVNTTIFLGMERLP
ncbi:MAG: tetratricopeptide repeat protein, partial [Candidatus Binatia bacterium]